MKSTPRVHAILPLLGGAILLASSPARATAPAPSAAAAEPAVEHTMFMGLDLSVPQDGKNLAILDVEDDAIVVSKGGQPLRIPTRERNVRLQINHALKLSDGAATIEKVIAEPGYSPATDPRRKFARSAGAEGGVGASMDMATAGLRGSEIAYAVNTGVINSGAFAPGAEAGAAAAQAAMDASVSAMDDVGQSGMGDQFSTASYAQQSQEELAEGNFDALNVEFAVSSPVPLSSPWIAVLVKYRERDKPQGEPLTWVATKALAPIGPAATKIRFQQTGLPVGFRMESYQVHLFNKGQEIATTVAPMRTVLSADEAFQYRVADYVGSHKDKTLPAEPAPGEMSGTLRERLMSRYPNKPVYVRVLPDGRSEGAFLDKACTKPVGDTDLEAMLARTRFNPALEKGKPVKGVVMLVGKPT